MEGFADAIDLILGPQGGLMAFAIYIGAHGAWVFSNRLWRHRDKDKQVQIDRLTAHIDKLNARLREVEDSRVRIALEKKIES